MIQVFVRDRRESDPSRLEHDRQCILVMMGATAEGKKERIAEAVGYRESEQSWKDLRLERAVGSAS